jgi:DNA-binding MarR family transcriptional regulator
MSISPGSESGRDPDGREPLGERWIRFIQASMAASRRARQLLAQVGTSWHLSDAEILLLWTFAQETPDKHRESDLAGPLGLTNGQLSATLYDLRDRGLIAFRLIPDDEAPQPIELTVRGAAALHDVLETLTLAAQAWDSQATGQELSAGIHLLQRLAVVSDSQGPRRLRISDLKRSATPASTIRGAA